MPEPDLLEHFRSDVAAPRPELRERARAGLGGPAQPERPRRRGRLLLAGAVALAVLAVSITRPWSTGDGGDDVARAAAVLALTPGTVIHVRSVGHDIYSPFLETWFVSGSGAWRERHGGESLRGPCTVEDGYDPASRVFSTFDAEKHVIDVRVVPLAHRDWYLPSDPIAALRQAVAHSGLRVIGHTRIGSRDVIRLEPPQGTWMFISGVNVQLSGYSSYFVDARTYAPVRFQVNARQWYDFTIYERLPLTPATRALTSVRAQHPGAAIRPGTHGSCGSG